MNRQWIQEKLQALPGKIGLYYKNLKTGEVFQYHADESFRAASVIKLPLLAALLYEVKAGKLRFDDRLTVTSRDKVPSCGALNYMHNGLEVTLLDLCYLMIIISDNTATNMAIRLLGFDRITSIFRSFGLEKTCILRLLFDEEAQARGIENEFTPREIGELLEKIYRGQLIDSSMSELMIHILKQQQINHKIPFLLPQAVEVAHKTGESSGITHDVGIVFAEAPFILCFASNETDVPLAEYTLHRLSRYFYDYSVSVLMNTIQGMDNRNE